MSIHVAILIRPYLDLILSGRKTIESRLTKAPLAPFRAIAVGERIYFKQSAGPFRGVAVAEGVEFHDDLTPAKVAELRRRLNGSICGDAQFWQWKRHSRYASFITLGQVQATSAAPPFEPSRGPAWFVLDDELDPMLDIRLRKGAIRNRYVPVAKASRHFPSGQFELMLPDGRRVQTDINARQLIRWRGWGAYYAGHGMQAEDVVRFIRVAPRRFEVAFVTTERQKA